MDHFRGFVKNVTCKGTAGKSNAKINSLQRRAPISISMVGMFVAVVLAAEVMAFLTYIAVRELVIAWDKPILATIPALPSPLATTLTPPPFSPNIPLQPASGPPALVWDGISQINFLVLGLDHRSGEETPPRTDTMLMLSLDPANQSIAMLALPGNLWVNIPGYDPYFLNTAYWIGEQAGTPGGGPGLAMKTVERLSGLRVDYYVEVDFYAFERLIDDIGGIEVEVPGKIDLNPLGKDKHVVLKPGVQVLSGNLALAYVRAPNPIDSVFDRMQRQQQVMVGIRNRILQKELLPSLIEKAPTLLKEIANGIHTNLSLAQAIQIVGLASQIPEPQIKRGLIGVDQVIVHSFPNGDTLLQPIPWDKEHPLDKNHPASIRQLSDELFNPYAPITPAATNPLFDLVKIEAAPVSVFNGSATPGLASRTVQYLQSKGVNVADIGNADKHYDKTILIDFTGNPNTLRYFLDVLNITPEQIYQSYDPNNLMGIAVFLGDDAVGFINCVFANRPDINCADTNPVP